MLTVPNRSMVGGVAHLEHLHSPAHGLRIIIPASGHIQTSGHLLAVLPTEAPRPAQVFGPSQDGLIREGKPPVHVPCTRAHVLLVMACQDGFGDIYMAGARGRLQKDTYNVSRLALASLQQHAAYAMLDMGQ
ncbi:MAG: hypothetical protein FRX49_04808 [Trebouxia sp. A1-2]|nr:MAG: hypothetical protein FRX49_04808 [Trebouxia sp. A1-2]